MEFVLNIILSLILMFVQWGIGYAVITFLIDGAFTFADIVIILWILIQIGYFYYKNYYNNKKNKE